MTKEEKFYKVLQDVFIGAKIEGQGGFVNLMKIKSNYYSKIEKILKDDIEKALKQYRSFREELFDKLYSFFNRYFTESGSIYFNSTPFHNNVYEKVYTDDKDVILFWKTQMLYYVKTDRIFKSMPIEFDNYKFYFDATTIENKKANEKRSLIYELKEVKEDKTIVFNVYYSEQGRVTKTDDILKDLKKKHINIDEETLERAFRIFEKQSEVDFFINKNAKAFLQEQFKLWSYQYFWEGAKEWTADRVNQLQILKDIAFKIIDFISQFEDELVKIWNKPKFVKNSNYVITLDRINNIELIEKILKHQNINEQIKEWQELGILDEKFKIEDVFETDLMGKRLSEKYKHLPIDTKYFKDLEFEILSLFDDLDNALDGWLIKSENYQALNTILPKFKEKVQTIYIDPPYNTGSDGFIYNDKFQHSSWLTMMENRLKLARELMKNDGAIFVSIDDQEQSKLASLLIEIFGDENFVINFIWQKKYSPANDAKWFSDNHDYIIVFAKNKEAFRPNLLPRTNEMDKRYFNPDNDPRGPWKPGGFSVKTYTKEYDYPIETPSGKIVYPPKGSCWQTSKENYLKKLKDNRIWFGPNNDSKPQIKQFLSEVQSGIVCKSIWTYDEVGHNQLSRMEIVKLFGDFSFPTPKPISLLKRVAIISSKKDSIVLDFFSGSGTTAHAVMKLNKEDGGKRKFILVEMGDYFETVIIPRIKKVAYSFNWKDGKAQDSNGIGIFFKYYELEQYEETLANTVYENHDMLVIGDKSPYEQYVFMKDEKMLRALEIDYENKKVNVDLSKLYENIDIAETISNLTGKWIKKIRENEVEFEDGSVVKTKDLDYKLIKPLIWWE